jgi:hypothetical protein
VRERAIDAPRMSPPPISTMLPLSAGGAVMAAAEAVRLKPIKTVIAPRTCLTRAIIARIEAQVEVQAYSEG